VFTEERHTGSERHEEEQMIKIGSDLLNSRLQAEELPSTQSYSFINELFEVST